MAKVALVTLAAGVHPARAGDPPITVNGEQVEAPACATARWMGRQSPCAPEELRQWRAALAAAGAASAARAALAASERPRALDWTASSFMQAQVMVHDRTLFDPETGAYTVDRFLRDVTDRYGGLDSVLLWHTYPNLGIDSRNQYDFLADLPGGADGVRGMVEAFHRAGVKVLFPVMVWDIGTRPAPLPDPEMLARALAAVGADGFNGDTLRGVPRAFTDASVALGHPLAAEAEIALISDEMLPFNPMTWSYWTHGFAPAISQFKWLDRRHMSHLCDRWTHDHTNDLQAAFLNGTGFETWENVWGIWNGITPRDAEAIRRVAAIERGLAPLLVSEAWEPYAPTLQFGVFASRWPGPDATLWTVVNRNPYPVSGEQWTVPARADLHYYDLWNGRELTPVPRDGGAAIAFDLDAGGYGAVLAAPALTGAARAVFDFARSRPKRVQDLPATWHSLPQTLAPNPPTRPAHAPPGMTFIPGGAFTFRVHGVEIEGEDMDGVDVQYPWEASPRRFHDHVLSVAPFWIDTTPVTNAAFKAFLDATHYRPRDDHNFLRDWHDGTYPAGWDDKPVTWVGLEDARAYAAWAGKRLPREWEWQYAAQGSDGRLYPWGDAWEPSAVPPTDDGREIAPPAAVTAHPAGASPFGLLDLVGNVWQWTDEYSDEHTRAAVLRGGSHYRPRDSNWYFPQAYRLDEHGKYLLMAPSLDRSAAIGFRCAADAEADQAERR